MLKRYLKKLFSAPAVQWIAAFALYLYINFAFATSRWRVDERSAQIIRTQGKKIYTFWHGDLIFMPCFRLKGEKVKVLISHHRDGAIITKVLYFFRIGVVRGSSRRGSIGATRSSLEALEQGFVLTITPDGPKGPRHVAKSGAAYLAQESGAIIIPMHWSSSRVKVLNTWDKFALPLPFGRGEFKAGEPIRIAPEADVLESSKFLEISLNKIRCDLNNGT
jgi:lysophospholipid acyltransferase (LPLAT)-like uncharacterized protein